jgi:hypothetical protein
MVLDDFLQLEKEALISSLDGYQQELIIALIDNAKGDYKLAADNWLSASPSNTAQFGGEHNKSSVFREKVFDEFEKFICGCDDGRYANDRDKLNKQGDMAKEAIISSISASIGCYLGVAAAFIAPVIVLILLSTGKIFKNAWCETQKEMKMTST